MGSSMKNRTFKDYWPTMNWTYQQGSYPSSTEYVSIKDMCRNAYNAGLREGKKKRPRAVKP